MGWQVGWAISVMRWWEHAFLSLPPAHPHLTLFARPVGGQVGCGLVMKDCGEILTCKGCGSCDAEDADDDDKKKKKGKDHS